MSDMTNSLTIGLASWIIQDGNYPDFKNGDTASFALEFYAPSPLSVDPERGQTASLEHLHDSTYRITAKVVHIRYIEWWAIDAGILMYREERPPRDVELRSLVTGEIYIGVDSFFCMERLSRHHTAPGLIYDWIIKKIEIQTAPFIKANGDYMIRDPEKLGWREVDATNAWHDGMGAEYILHCQRLDNPPRR
jgi:hypothetical protein